MNTHIITANALALLNKWGDKQRVVDLLRFSYHTGSITGRQFDIACKAVWKSGG